VDSGWCYLYDEYSKNLKVCLFERVGRLGTEDWFKSCLSYKTSWTLE